MKRNLIKTFATAGAAALLLAACSDDSGSADEGNGSDESQDPVYAEMTSWNACEVLDNLQPITDYMDIKGYGSSTAEGGEPGNSEIGNTLDPDAIGCNGVIYLGSYQDLGMSGEIQVKIVPAEDEDQASSAYLDRVSSAESEASQWDDIQSEEFGDPWDEGTMISWIGDAENPTVEVVARDGQWVFHIVLYHNYDRGERVGDSPSLSFTPEERNQWLVETYLPEVNQAVNDRIAEVQ